jgi:hypothetical protein
MLDDSTFLISERSVPGSGSTLNPGVGLRGFFVAAAFLGEPLPPEKEAFVQPKIISVTTDKDMTAKFEIFFTGIRVFDFIYASK